MDKNMIKIDDLLRQRFDDAKEQERPAAWLQMRDLLDKQMPVTRAAVNWRRMFAYVAGVALLAALSVGSYQMSQSFYADDTSVAENTGTGAMQGDAPSSNGVAGAAINSLPDTRAQAKQAAAQAAQTTAQPADIATNSAATSGTIATTNSTDGQNSTSNQLETAQKATNRNNQQGTSTNSTSAKSATSNPVASNNRIGNNSNPSEAVNSKNNQTNATATNRNISSARNTNGNEIVPATASTNGKKADAPAIASNTKTASSNNGDKANNNKGNAANNNNVVGNAAKQENDYANIPVRKIEREEKVAKGGTTRMDTIFNGDDVKKVKMPKEEQLAANTNNNNDEELASGSNITPAAALNPAKKEVDAEGTPSKKLGDRKENPGKQKGNKPPRFEEVVRNANLKMGAVKFYPGILGGVNFAFNGNYGIHGGLAGNLTVGDRWAILTEVKYAFRFNNVKETINDDYIENVQSTTLNGQHAYTYDSMQHYYTFKNYASLEIPLMLTYTQNKFVYMLGANFRYNFTIAPPNLTEIEQKYMLAQSYTTTSEPKFATEKQVLLSDFGSSFNIAPMIGFGYKINPSMTLDARLSKSVWNNANSTGQTEIYKRLYNMPQLQINYTIRPSFGGKKGYKRAQ